MNKSICFLLGFIILNLVSSAQMKDYFHYHNRISEMENKIYIEDNIYLALDEYIQLFEQYEFSLAPNCYYNSPTAYIIHDGSTEQLNSYMDIVFSMLENFSFRHLTV